MKNKKTILGSSAAIVAAAALLAGGTFAAWSDFAVVEDNAAQAGILQLNVGVREGAGTTIQPLNLAPGQNKTQTFYLASNDAESVPAADLTMTLENLVDTEADGDNRISGRTDNCTTNSEAVAEGGTEASAMAQSGDCGTEGELSSQLRAQVLWSAPVPNAASCPNTGIYNSGGASQLLSNREDVAVALGQVNPGEGICVRIEKSLPLTATDAVQGDLVSYDLRFDLNQ